MSDLISRQAVMKEFSDFVRRANNSDFAKTPTWNDAVSLVGSLPSAEVTLCHLDSPCEYQNADIAMPSAQQERRCVNCGRTVNNGGWYEDGRTRCPIEEHYALPKDGYCHLWEKRKDWEDDYVKRAEEGENRWTTR